MFKQYLPFVIVGALIALLLIVRFAVGEKEDRWICENGLWIPHGHPASPMPREECGQSVPTRLTFSLSSPAALSTSSVSSTVAPCPAYVNCMPGPDVNRHCIIPPGCENVTQKVY